MFVGVNPIQDPEEQYYPKRVEKFCREVVLRRSTNPVTREYSDALVERLFTADELRIAEWVPTRCAR